ncbi:hypothetical protein LSCM1_04887 [Leishmania martiniquensis]|uniref:Uncharacterized protein n=1 Tax=Leishmania martiniquensis TaxID=1580590 RepID=A0A836HUW0_9TRYP|nr:hypothetical protein LSCM1_04887 [Leishmania martiniquensis]
MPVKRLTALTLKGSQGGGVGDGPVESGGSTAAAAAAAADTDGVRHAYLFPATNEEEVHPGVHAPVVTFSRGGAISRLLTPPPSRAESVGSNDCYNSQCSRSDNSSLFHSCYSSGAHSSAERAGTASPTLIPTHCRSYRHNPYIASPGAAGSPLMPESPESVSCTEHESARDLSLGGGHFAGEHGRRCIIRSRHAQSSSRSTSGCSRKLAEPIAGMGYHASSLLQPQQLVAALPPQHSVESLSREGSFLGRSDPSSVGQSCRSSPAAAAAPLAMLLASASSFRGAQHGAHHHHPPTQYQSNATYGAGGTTPETSTLYQSLSSVNVTVSTNSNNPYIGVRMTPETTLLQPQGVALSRSFEGGPRTVALESNMHPLLLYEPQSQELLLPREPNQHETRAREAQQQQQRMAAPLPMQVVSVLAHGSRYGNSQASPMTSALGEGSRAYRGAARTASVGHASVTKRPPSSMSAARNPTESFDAEPGSPVQRQEQRQQQQRRPLSLPSYSSSPHERWMRGCSPHSVAQQLRATPKPLADHISSPHGATMPAVGSAAMSIGSTSVGGTSRSHSGARDTAPAFSTFPAVASTVSPVPMAETGLALDALSSSRLQDVVADGEGQHRQAVGSARPQPPASSPFVTPPRYQDAGAEALNSTHTDLLSETAPQLTPNSASGADWPFYPLQDSSTNAAGTYWAEGENAHGYGDASRLSQHGYVGALREKGAAEDTLAEFGASEGRLSPSAPLATAATSGTCGFAPTGTARHFLDGAVPSRVRGENDVDISDEEEKGLDDDEGSVTAADATHKSKRKKKRARRNRKAKVLEDLPPATSMKYLPPPPPPLPPGSPRQLNRAGAPAKDAPSTPAFDRYYAILLRWYKRLLADEADFVDIANARSFDAATAAAALSAEAREVRDGSHTAADKPPSVCPRQPLHSGPITPLMGPVSPPLMPTTVPAYLGGTGSGTGNNAEVHVRCPRIEQYMAPCDIPAELLLLPTPNTALNNPGGNQAETVAETQATGTATMVVPHSVKDVPSAVRWARDLETWWFCYVFPHAAHTRHLPLTWPPASISPASLTISHTGAGAVGYEYPYGWPTVMPQPMMVSPIQSVYGAHGNGGMGSGHAIIGSGMGSPVYAHVPMQHQMPPPLPPMPPGYLMGVYSTY